MGTSRLVKQLAFLDETIDYFEKKVEGVDRDRYFSDRDIRSILDKTLNDLILCVTDISKEFLRARNRSVPDTYRDMVLACHEFIGSIVLSVAPLTKSRNEIIHQYLKVNWQNVMILKTKIPDVREFAEAIKRASEPSETVDEINTPTP